MNTLYIVTHLLFSTTYFLCLLHEETEAHRLYKTSANSHDKQVAGMDGNETVESRACLFSTYARNAASWFKSERLAVILSLLITLGLESSHSSALSLSSLNHLPGLEEFPARVSIQVSGCAVTDSLGGRGNFSL